jgi:hypothetical protein
MLLKYDRRIITINGIEPEDMATTGAQKVPNSPILLNIRYMGVSISDGGSICETKKASNMILRPGTLYLPIP